MSATVTPISSHPRFESNDAYTHRRSLEAKAKAALSAAPPAPPPPPAREESVFMSCAETAKLVRAALKKAFPGVKFGVRSKSYSGGASISVAVPAGGPASAEVEKITGIYSGAGFDGMNDLKFHYKHWILPDGTVTVASSPGSGASYEPFSHPKPHPDAKRVSLGADFIFVHRMDS